MASTLTEASPPASSSNKKRTGSPLSGCRPTPLNSIRSKGPGRGTSEPSSAISVPKATDRFTAPSVSPAADSTAADRSCSASFTRAVFLFLECHCITRNSLARPSRPSRPRSTGRSSGSRSLTPTATDEASGTSTEATGTSIARWSVRATPGCIGRTLKTRASASRPFESSWRRVARTAPGSRRNRRHEHSSPREAMKPSSRWT